MRADRSALIEIARGLKPAEWESPSGCPGWSTKDLVSHLAATFWAVVDQSAGPDTPGLEMEEASALRVEARRSMTPAEVLAEFAQEAAGPNRTLTMARYAIFIEAGIHPPLRAQLRPSRG